MTITPGGNTKFSNSIYRHLIESLYRSIREYYRFSCFDSLNLPRLAFRALPDVIENVVPHPRPVVSLSYLLISMIHALMTTHKTVMEGFDDLIFIFCSWQVRLPILSTTNSARSPGSSFSAKSPR